MSCVKTLLHPNDDPFSFHFTVMQSSFYMTLTIYFHFSSSLACLLIKLSNKPGIQILLALLLNVNKIFSMHWKKLCEARTIFH